MHAVHGASDRRILCYSELSTRCYLQLNLLCSLEGAASPQPQSDGFLDPVAATKPSPRRRLEVCPPPGTPEVADSIKLWSSEFSTSKIGGLSCSANSRQRLGAARSQTETDMQKPMFFSGRAEFLTQGSAPA